LSRQQEQAARKETGGKRGEPKEKGEEIEVLRIIKQIHLHHSESYRQNKKMKQAVRGPRRKHTGKSFGEKEKLRRPAKLLHEND